MTEWVGEVRRVVVVLVDGMGWHLLPELAADAPLLASVLAGNAGRLDELTCTFPSTTPTSLASLTTGATPGEHGILGFTVKLPDSDMVLNHIFWRGDPPAAQWQPVPTWFERLRHAGVGARAVLPAAFLGSGLTEAAYRGAELHAANSDDDALRPTHFESLLALARREHAEVPYGCLDARTPDGVSEKVGVFPPARGLWGMQTALMHRGLRVRLVTDSRAIQYSGLFSDGMFDVVPSETLRGRSPVALARAAITLSAG